MNFFFLYLMARNDTPSYVARGDGATETHTQKNWIYGQTAGSEAEIIGYSVKPK